MIEAGEPLSAREAFGASRGAAAPAGDTPSGRGRAPMLRRFIADFYQYSRPQALKAALFIGLGAAVEGVGLLLLVPLLGVVLGGGSGSQWVDRFTFRLFTLTAADTQLARLGVVLAIFGATVVARGLVIRARDVLLANLQVGFIEAQRLKIIQLLAGSRWEATTRLRHGRIMHVLGGDVESCGDAASLLLQAAIGAALLTGQALLMFLLSPGLAAVIMLLLVGGAAAMKPLLGRAQRLGHSLTDANLELVTGTSQFLGALKLALSQGLQLGFLRSFQSALAAAAQRRVAFVRQRSETQLLVTTAAALIASLVILIGIGMFEAAPATLLAFLFVMSRMVAPLSMIQIGMQQVFHSLPAYGKIKALQSELGAAQAADPGAAAKEAPAGAISFRNVGFRHVGDAEGEGQGLYDLDLVIEPGSIVGLVGPSGAGKTTFCDLLVGLYPPRTGIVTVGGTPLEGAAVAAWRNALSYVSQDPFLFHDSIRGNLLWARADASEDELWDALEIADAAGFVRLLPDGLETVVGERGGLVSGGERQRLAIARALVRRPKLLVLDEATNAIDVAGERALLKRLAALPNRPTIIIVAHRDASLHFCQRVIELRDGRLVGDRVQ